MLHAAPQITMATRAGGRLLRPAAVVNRACHHRPVMCARGCRGASTATATPVAGSMMRAIVVRPDDPGSKRILPSALKLGEVPVPEVGPGDVLIKVCGGGSHRSQTGRSVPPVPSALCACYLL